MPPQAGRSQSSQDGPPLVLSLGRLRPWNAIGGLSEIVETIFWSERAPEERKQVPVDGPGRLPWVA